jgi:hypothetical protein
MDASQALYEWSKRLTHEQVDEDDVTIVVGGGRHQREIISRNCTVRGRRDGVPVVVTYHSYFAESGALGGARLRRWVLEAFATGSRLQIEGQLGPFTTWQRFVRLFRKQAAPHPLFAEFSVAVDDSPAGRDQLSRRAFLDGALAVLRRPGCWRLLLERGTGITTFDSVGAAVPTPPALDALVATNVDLLERLGD